MQNIDLTNHFLIAMPNMADPYFSKTLTYICEHNDKGALGVVVNKPVEVTWGNLFDQVDIPLLDQDLRQQHVYFGGPVQVDRGFVLHQPIGQWGSTLSINAEVALTTSRDILQALSDGTGPQRALLSLGYAGWGAGQLEDEIQRNGWLTVSASPNLIFDFPPEDRLTAAMGMLGLNHGNFSDQAGHA